LQRLQQADNNLFGFVSAIFSALHKGRKMIAVIKKEHMEMNRDLKILEFNDETEVDSSQTEEIRQDMTDLKEGDRVTIYYDDQNVIYRVEIEPEQED
jgi:hypothetical protein